MFLFGLIVGFLAGTVLTCILLAKKNLERYEKVSNDVEDATSVFKSAYKASMKAKGFDDESENNE